MNNLENFNGPYGFVIETDNETQRLAELLSNKIAPNAEFRSVKHHITLYHAKFSNLSKGVVKGILSDLRSHSGTSFELNKLQVYGDKFLFWDVERNFEIETMHEISLKAAGFLNKKSSAKAVEEGLRLDELEKQNLKIYGYPLVLEKYLPHITLAYDSRGINLPKLKIYRTMMTVENVLFCRMGKFGSIESVIDI